MVSCDALVRSGVPFLPGLTMVPQNEEPDIAAVRVDGRDWVSVGDIAQKMSFATCANS